MTTTHFDLENLWLKDHRRKTRWKFSLPLSHTCTDIHLHLMWNWQCNGVWTNDRIGQWEKEFWKLNAVCESTLKIEHAYSKSKSWKLCASENNKSSDAHRNNWEHRPKKERNELNEWSEVKFFGMRTSTRYNCGVGFVLNAIKLNYTLVVTPNVHNITPCKCHSNNLVSLHSIYSPLFVLSESATPHRRRRQHNCIW